MTDRPIIFSSQMVKSLIAGTKTQTRRVLKPQPYFVGLNDVPSLPTKRGYTFADELIVTSENIDACTAYEVGDRLWVREGWKVLGRESDGETELAMEYLADGAKYKFTSPEEWGATLAAWRSRGAVKRPSIHMPRWASRTTLTVTDVRVQRLQEISEEDAVAEGVYRSEPTNEDREWYRGFCEENGGNPDEPMEGVWMAPGARQGWGMTKEMRNRDQWGPTAAFAYRCVWNSIHGKDAWSINPWVCALTFAVEHRNIDAVAAMNHPAPDTLVLTEGER